MALQRCLLSVGPMAAGMHDATAAATTSSFQTNLLIVVTNDGAILVLPFGLQKQLDSITRFWKREQ